MVAPLYWGLGHATRCIPIIDALLQKKCLVHIASDGAALKLLQARYPDLISHTLPSYNVNYGDKSMMWNMLLQAPKMWKAKRQEKNLLDRLHKEHQWDVIISDNRYGIYTKKATSVFLSHQLNIQADFKIASLIANKIQQKLFASFDQIWVPDQADHLLSGALSDASDIKKKTHFIGPLSRLRPLKLAIKNQFCVILSGPEPSRTQLEKKLINILTASKKKIVFIRGKQHLKPLPVPENIIVKDLLDSEQINQAICSAEMVICRSGYSSIMDLHALNKKAILIPTPGQTEQEYLGKHLAQNSLFTVIAESELNALKSYL